MLRVGPLWRLISRLCRLWPWRRLLGGLRPRLLRRSRWCRLRCLHGCR